jgi:DNA polymerase III subunit epsilon
MDFVALDVETANSDLASICAIGLVHFRAGEVYRSLGLLIDPQDHFDPTNILIHGIRPEDVLGKPRMREAIRAITQNLQDCVIVHHTAFDRAAFHRASVRFGVDMPSVFWLDSARVARRAWSECSKRGYGLADLCAKFDITFRHHDAAEDARAAGMILLRAISDTGIALENWFEHLDSRYYGEQRPRRSGNRDGWLVGETVVFTGKLKMTRKEAADLAAAAGCDVRPSVTRETTILVVGDQDIRLLNGHDKSSKHRQAESLIADGAPLRIFGESDFLEMMRASAG